MLRFHVIAVLLAIGTSRSVHTSTRIIGGENAVIEAFPYQVSLVNTLSRMHFCGGSIISPEYVVTAAHCWNAEESLKRMKVRSGTTWVSKGGSLHSVKEFIVHEGYRVRDDGTPLNDIALVKLEKPIQFGKKQRAIEMFKANETTYKGEWAEVTGWGLTKKARYKGQLQSVSIPIITRDRCEAMYSKYPGQETPAIPDGQLCTGFYGVGGKDSCTGDSGGPLAIKGRFAGIVSWGAGCGSPKWPGVYTEIAYYREWIRNQTGI